MPDSFTSKTNSQVKKIARGGSYLRIKNILNNVFYLVNAKNKAQIIALYEKEFSDYFLAKHTITFPYARTALYYILKAYNFPPDSEIITTPITIKDIINSIILNGLKPVFVDLSPNTANMDASQLEKKITPKTKAILVTHLNGMPSDMATIIDIAKRFDLFVFEDASQSIGGKYKGQYIGSLGDVGFFSTSSQKPLCTLMGGVVVTKQEKIANQLRQFSNELYKNNFLAIILATLRELLISIFLNKRIFGFFTFNLIRVMNLISFKLCDSMQHFEFRKVKRRNKTYRELFVTFSSFQAKLGIEGLKSLESDTLKRVSLGRLLYFELEKK